MLVVVEHVGPGGAGVQQRVRAAAGEVLLEGAAGRLVERRWGRDRGVQLVERLLGNSKSKQTELEIRIYFCKKMRAARISLDASAVINNLFYREIDKIKLLFSKLHEDLQMDYRDELEALGCLPD